MDLETHNLCGGTLINSLNVLTAAHCITGSIVTTENGERTLPSIDIAIGDWRLFDEDEWEQHHQVRKFWIHPDADVAILELNEDVELNTCVQSSILYSQRPSLSKPLMVAGWGVKSSDPTDVANEIQELVVPMVDNTVRYQK